MLSSLLSPFYLMLSLLFLVGKKKKNPKKVPIEKSPKVRLNLSKLGGLPLQSVERKQIHN